VFLGCQVEKAVDELNLTKKIISCHPSNLPLADHVDCFVALNRSPSRPEFSEALPEIPLRLSSELACAKRCGFAYCHMCQLPVKTLLSPGRVSRFLISRPTSLAPFIVAT
jgi:hypothetical protein